MAGELLYGVQNRCAYTTDYLLLKMDWMQYEQLLEHVKTA